VLERREEGGPKVRAVEGGVHLGKVTEGVEIFSRFNV
jgi:hypothetical protein